MTDLTTLLTSDIPYLVLMCVGLWWYILKKDKLHWQERWEWKESYDKNTKATNDTMVVLTELKTIIKENRK